MHFPGSARLEFTSAPSPRTFRTVSGKRTELLEVCKTATPACHLNSFLFNGHLQTMWNITKPKGPALYYRRMEFISDDDAFPGIFAVDFAVAPFKETDSTLFRRTVFFSENELNKLGSLDTKPMLIVLHGLLGGSHEVYLRHAIAPLVQEGLWQVCVVNSRGCAQSKLRGALLYNGAITSDLRQTITWIGKNFPNRRLFALGFSLGANILTHYCGEEGQDCPLTAAIACSNPFDIETGMRSLCSSFVGHNIYLRTMAWHMKRVVNSHAEELARYTDLDIAKMRQFKYSYEFDTVIQCGANGYTSPGAYYRDTSSVKAIDTIQIPFLAIHSLDDPIAVREALPYNKIRNNANTVMITTSRGGHVAWFEWGGSRWVTKPIYNFLHYMAFHIDHRSPSQRTRTTLRANL